MVNVVFNNILQNLEDKIIKGIVLFLPISFCLGNAALNINVVLIDVLFLLKFNKNLSSIFKLKSFKVLLFIWCAIVLKDIILYSENFYKSIGLVRYLVFVFALKSFFEIYKELNKYFFWNSIILITFLILDINIQFFTGTNILGLETGSSYRVSSIFGSEWIAGSFLLKFSFLFLPFFYYYKRKKSNLIAFFYVFFVLEATVLSGDRTPLFQLVFILLLFPLILENSLKKTFKNYLIIFISLSAIFLFTKNVYNKPSLDRYSKNIFAKYINLDEGTQTRLMHYGLIMSKDNIIFGIGTDNFYKKCLEYEKKNSYFKRCENHPHHHLVELITEQGLPIFLVILFSFLIFFYKKITDFKNLSILSRFRLISLLIYFLPFFFSGSFFSTWTASFFFFNLGILFSDKNYTS